MLTQVKEDFLTQNKAAVALFIFNRPENVIEIMNAIRAYKPEKLLIVADGPRREKHLEEQLCIRARELALNVDWDCQILTDFAENNLGCKNRIVSGINWVFSHVESAILLEDDCIPDLSFFMFASEMLEKYKNNSRIGMVSADNYLFDRIPINDSYYFSKYSHIWGWATWRRAWETYDSEMTIWKRFSKEEKKVWLESKFASSGEVKFWNHAFSQVTHNNLDTWDYQWAFNMFNIPMLSIVPQTNLVHNIGITADATHTSKPTLESTAVRGSISFPLTHPEETAVENHKADNWESRQLFRRTFFKRISKKIQTKWRILLSN